MANPKCNTILVNLYHSNEWMTHGCLGLPLSVFFPFSFCAQKTSSYSFFSVSVSNRKINVWMIHGINPSSSCFHHYGSITCFHFLSSSTGRSPHWRNGPGWWRADLGGRSFKESRNLSEQWSDGLRQTAARISRRVVAAQRWPVFSSL